MAVALALTRAGNSATEPVVLYVADVASEVLAPVKPSSIVINAAFDCAEIFVVVASTLLFVTNQAYVLDPSATAATHTMATAAPSCFLRAFTLPKFSFFIIISSNPLRLKCIFPFIGQGFCTQIKLSPGPVN